MTCARGGPIRSRSPPSIDPEVVSWPTAIEAFQPDAVLLYTSAWDASDRRIPSLGPDWVHAGQEVFDEYALSEYELAADTLTESGATLYWMLGAPLNRPVIPQNDPERIERLNELVLEAVDGNENIEIVDYPRDSSVRSAASATSVCAATACTCPPRAARSWRRGCTTRSSPWTPGPPAPPDPAEIPSQGAGNRPFLGGISRAGAGQ